MNIKETFAKCKNWVKEHKKVVIGTGLAVAAGIGAVVLGKKVSSKSNEVLELPDDIDYGRDCTMRFVVNETQEVLGEVPCTELYAKEEIQDYNMM